MNPVLEIASRFRLEGTPMATKECTVGHINNTCFVDTDNPAYPRYVLQKVNTNVFTRPVEVMENMVAVCAFLKKKVKEQGGDPDRETITLIPAKDGKYYYIAPNGDFWRCYVYMDKVVSYNLAETPDMFRSAGISFGHFFNLLSDFPADTLHITIPNFHNTVSRFADLKTAIEKDAAGRAKNIPREIEFALAHESICSYIVDRLDSGEFKLGVTHNDTKLNNILFDKKTGKGLCIIDLDTVMPGSILYDYGDAIRFGASSALEDEKDLDKVFVVPEMFEAFTAGFLSEIRPSISEAEIRAFPIAATLITFEIGIRFLADYLNVDVYFRTAYEDHNLVRARNQFKLVADGEAKRALLDSIVEKYI